MPVDPLAELLRRKGFREQHHVRVEFREAGQVVKQGQTIEFV